MDNIIPHGYLKTLLPMIRDSEMDLRIFCETKANLKREDVQTYAQAGLTLVQPGIESLSDNVLRIMRKGVSAIQNILLLKLGTQYGVQLQWNVLCGFPGETERDYLDQIALFPHLWHLHPPAGCSWFGVQRFSPFHFESEKLGLRNVHALSSYRYLFPVHRIDPDRIAFYFSFEYTDDYTISDDLKFKLRRAARDWGNRSSKPGAPPELKYQRGPGFVHVLDSREPRSIKNHQLTGLEADIFLACDDIVGLKDLVQRFGDETLVASAIRDLAAIGLVFFDGRRVLNLAVPDTTKSIGKRPNVGKFVHDDEKATLLAKLDTSLDDGEKFDRMALEGVKDGVQFF
jgi:ribosomal peptide maturation radical SAM protein 1